MHNTNTLCTQDGAKPDDRALWCASMLSLPAARITPLLYPRLLPVHHLLGHPPAPLPNGIVSGLVFVSVCEWLGVCEFVSGLVFVSVCEWLGVCEFVSGLVFVRVCE